MSLFKKKPKFEPGLTVPHTDTFKGYKRIKLATYKDKNAHAGIRDLGSAPISYVGFQIYEDPQNKCVNVYADGNRIGTIWKHSWENYYKAIKSGKVSAAHVMINDPDEVYLFIAL